MWGGLVYVSDVSHRLLPRSAAATAVVAHDVGVVTETSGGYPLHRFSLNAERTCRRGHSPHFSPHLEPLLCDPNLVMSSLSGSAASGEKVPEGSKEEVRAPEMAPSASRKRGRPKGSRNKRTLEALAAMAAAAPSTFVAPRATGAPSDAGVPKKRRPGHPKGSGRKTASAAAAAPLPPRHHGRPPGSKNKKAPAALGGHRLHFCEAPSGSFASSGSITALVGETGTSITGPHLS
jgi:hypothetical protein